MNQSTQSRSNQPSRRAFLEQTGAAALASTGLALASDGRLAAAERRKAIRMAVVGGGFGATFHWHEHPQCEVTAVTDLRPDRREALRKHYKCDNVHDSLEEMIRKEQNVDAVAIFSGAPDHAKHVKMCMDRGWHVVSACPACVSLEEANMLKEVKEKTGLKYMMAESSYYRQPCIAAREMFEQGKFGNLFYSEVEYYHPSIGTNSSGYSFYQGKPTWRWGFTPMLYPTHSLGLLVGVTKERITEVSCLGIKGGDDFPAPEKTQWKNPFVSEMALGKTDRGNMCRFGVFWHGVADGERGQWFGEKMACYMGGSGQSPAITVEGQGTKPWAVPDYWKTDRLPEPMRHPSGHGGSAAFLSAEFVDALLEDREPTVDLYESLAMTVPGIVGHQSALKGGEQLEVPQFDSTKA